MGHQGALGVSRGCRSHCGVSGASGGVGGVGVYCWWQVDWEPNHIGPQSRFQAVRLVPFGE